MKRKPDFKNGIFHGKPIYVLAVILLTVLLVISILTAVTIGSVDLSVKDVYSVILYKVFGIGDPEVYGVGAMSDIVWFIRLPRILLATAVGMGLAVAGVVMQAIVKNPIADPYILGISSGASLGATVAIFLGVGAVFGSNSIGICAFIGAFLISVLVQITANIGGRANSVRLLLAGTALGSVCSAFSNFVVYIAGDRDGIQTVTFWLMGSLAGAKWENLAVIIPCVFIATLFFCTQSRILNMMLLGDEVSITLGTDLHRYRQVYLVVTALLIGFVVYSAGIIGFVGLIIPHVVRMFFGTDHKKMLPLSALSGSIFLIWADVASRIIIPKSEVPIGILVSMIGAPCFIYLLVGIIGPNGSGKSTLLKCIYRVLKPDTGVIMLDGKPLNEYKVKDSAKALAVVSQHNYYNFEFSVQEIVMMGRAPHKKTMERDNAEDYKIVEECLEKVGMLPYRHRVFSSLSGGEQQRIILARALAQKTDCLILDEPTNHLDIKYQLQLLDIVKSLGVTVIGALHDLNIAAAYCDRIYAMKNGRLVACGTPEEVITEDFIHMLYEVDATVKKDEYGMLNVTYHPLHVKK